MNYFSKSESYFKYSKEYLEEENCIFHLISNKKESFKNFFPEFFIDLPGFTSIYKDKFFSKLNELIDDEKLFFELFHKYESKIEKSENCVSNTDNINNKEINEIKKNLLGLKRKRNKDKELKVEKGEKGDNNEEEKLSEYGNELLLLEMDYPQIIDNKDSVQIKNEDKKEDDNKDKNKDNKDKTKDNDKNKDIKQNDKDIPVKKEKNDENEINNINKNKENKENKDNNEVKQKEKEIPKQHIPEKKSKKTKIKESKKDNLNLEEKEEEFPPKNGNKSKKSSKVNNKFHRNRIIPYSQNASKKKKKKSRYISINKSYYTNIYSPVKTTNYNNILTNVIENTLYNSYDNNRNDFFGMHKYQEYSPNPLNISFGINSRLDKMPKINVYQKKKHQINYSAGKLLNNIKEKLSNIDPRNKMMRKRRVISEDKLKREEMQKLNQIVNNNFYGKERLKSPDVKETNNENNINYATDVNPMNKVKKFKKKKLVKGINTSKSTKKIVFNKNTSLGYKIILSYKKENNERIITKSEFVPESIIIEKKAIEMSEIKSLFSSISNKIKREPTIKENIKKRRRRRKKKPPKEVIEKRQIMQKNLTQFRKLRKSTRIQHVKNISKVKLSYKKKLRRRSKIFIRRKAQREEKKISKNKNKKEERAYDSGSENCVLTAGKIRTNLQESMDITNNTIDGDNILVKQTDNFDSGDGGVSNRNSKRRLSNYNFDSIEAIKGFNYLFNQK